MAMKKTTFRHRQAPRGKHRYSNEPYRIIRHTLARHHLEEAALPSFGLVYAECSGGIAEKLADEKTISASDIYSLHSIVLSLRRQHIMVICVRGFLEYRSNNTTPFRNKHHRRIISAAIVSRRRLSRRSH